MAELLGASVRRGVAGGRGNGERRDGTTINMSTCDLLSVILEELVVNL